MVPSVSDESLDTTTSGEVSEGRREHQQGSTRHEGFEPGVDWIQRGWPHPRSHHADRR